MEIGHLSSRIDQWEFSRGGYGRNGSNANGGDVWLRLTLSYVFVAILVYNALCYVGLRQVLFCVVTFKYQFHALCHVILCFMLYTINFTCIYFSHLFDNDKMGEDV